MSASLVGSEMCIRDSFRRAGGGDGPPNSFLPRFARGAAGAAWCGVVWRCLLYTSDAADDM
eukprot:7838923-Alexandrium_andersonii.AAC.1